MQNWLKRVFVALITSISSVVVCPIPSFASDDVVRRITTQDKVLALTFDDGPSPTFTPKVLSLLEQYHARATFFVIGERVKQYPDIVRREVTLKNQVENHTYHHIVVTGKGKHEIEMELSQSEKDISSVTGFAPHFFRPPGGHYDATSVNVAEQHGYITVLWSVDSRDWSDPGVEDIVLRVMKNVHSGDIVLFHDQGGNRAQTIQALRVILPKLEAEGYRFVTLSELFHLDFQGWNESPALGGA